MPLCGKRASYWTEVRLDTRFPLIGTRGPANGVANPRVMAAGQLIDLNARVSLS